MTQRTLITPANLCQVAVVSAEKALAVLGGHAEAPKHLIRVITILFRALPVRG